jgi:hypothetical protein
LIARHPAEEPNDSVNLVVSLLVRHPELSRIVIRRRFAAIAFFFVVKGTLTRDDAIAFRRSVGAHSRAFHSLSRERAPRVSVRVRSEEGLSFVEIERETSDLSRDEIAMLVSLVSDSFGERLLVNPPAEGPSDEESTGAREDAVGDALDAVRRAKQRKSLVGLRDERRVLIYFGK